MKKNKGNFMDYIPVPSSKINYTVIEDGTVVIDIVHKGLFDKIAQVFFHRPKVSHISLDQYGNFIWPLMDGKRTVYDIALLVDEHFGEEAKPLYDRLVQYLRILSGHGFIELKNN